MSNQHDAVVVIFCDLETETLTMMTLCLMPNIQSFKHLGETMAAVEYDPMDLIGFIQKNFAPLNHMHRYIETLLPHPDFSRS